MTTDDQMNYPKIELEEVYQLGKQLVALNNGLQKPIQLEYFSAKDAKDIILNYIVESGLEQDAKKGHVNIDPLIAKLVGDLKPDQTQVRKDMLFKSLQTQLHPCYLIMLIDKDQLVSEKLRQRFVKGPVPPVSLHAYVHHNKKKVTQITGLEMWQIDLAEFQSFVQNKCAGAVSISENLGTVKQPKYSIQLQGAHIKALEDILVDRYKIPRKYIQSQDDTGKKKKK